MRLGPKDKIFRKWCCGGRNAVWANSIAYGLMVGPVLCSDQASLACCSIFIACLSTKCYRNSEFLAWLIIKSGLYAVRKLCSLAYLSCCTLCIWFSPGPDLKFVIKQFRWQSCFFCLICTVIVLGYLLGICACISVCCCLEVSDHVGAFMQLCGDSHPVFLLIIAWCPLR